MYAKAKGLAAKKKIATNSRRNIFVEDEMVNKGRFGRQTDACMYVYDVSVCIGEKQ